MYRPAIFVLFLIPAVLVGGAFALTGEEVTFYLDEIVLEQGSFSDEQSEYIAQVYNRYQSFDVSMSRLRRRDSSYNTKFEAAVRDYLVKREVLLEKFSELREGGSSRFRTLKPQLDKALKQFEQAYTTARAEYE